MRKRLLRRFEFGLGDAIFDRFEFVDRLGNPLLLIVPASAVVVAVSFEIPSFLSM
jgi:hypothetical protein